MEPQSLRPEVIECGPARLIGKQVIVPQGKTALKHVRAFREDGSHARLIALPGRISPEGDLANSFGYDLPCAPIM